MAMTDLVEGTAAQTCKPVARVTGVRIELDPPHWLQQRIPGDEDSPAYWKAVRIAFELWVDDLRQFIQDHRSRDDIVLSVINDTDTVCSACGEWWDVDKTSGARPMCASCLVPVETEQDNPAVAR